MKTNSNIIKTSVIASAAFARALILNAADQMKPMKGAEHLLMVNQINSKGDITELKHSCKARGDDSAFCCATKPGSGATHDMDKK